MFRYFTVTVSLLESIKGHRLIQRYQNMVKKLYWATKEDYF